MHTRRYRAETLVREGQIWATPWERSRVRRVPDERQETAEGRTGVEKIKGKEKR